MTYEELETLLINVSYEYNRAGVMYDELPVAINTNIYYSILANIASF